MIEFDEVCIKYSEAKRAYWKAEREFAAARSQLTIAERARDAVFNKMIEAAEQAKQPL